MSVQDVASAALRHGRAARALVDEVEDAPPSALILAGAAGPTSVLERELGEGASPGSLRRLAEGPFDGDDLAEGMVLVYSVIDEPTPDDVERLRVADRARLPIVCLVVDPAAVDPPEPVPYVLARDVIRAHEPARLPLGSVADRIAVRAGADGFSLAVAIPRLRSAVSDAIVTHYARLNGAIGAASFARGATLPILTVNQLRMVARLAAVHGVKVDAKRAGELIAVVAAGLGFRSVARAALGRNIPRWAIKGGFAYGGTYAIGETAIARFSNMKPAPRTDAGTSTAGALSSAGAD
ncbi:MAG: hypothetical protein ACE5EV_01160 [Gaiellales bacterium]